VDSDDISALVAVLGFFIICGLVFFRLVQAKDRAVRRRNQELRQYLFDKDFRAKVKQEEKDRDMAQWMRDCAAKEWMTAVYPTLPTLKRILHYGKYRYIQDRVEYWGREGNCPYPYKSQWKQFKEAFMSSYRGEDA
jgi:hypothetical protein